MCLGNEIVITNNEITEKCQILCSRKFHPINENFIPEIIVSDEIVREIK